MEMPALGDDNAPFRTNCGSNVERLSGDNQQSRWKWLFWRDQVNHDISSLESFVISKSDGSDQAKLFQKTLQKLLHRPAWFLVEQHLWTGYEIPSCTKEPIADYFRILSDKSRASKLENPEDRLCLVVTSVYDIARNLNHLHRSLDEDLIGGSKLLPEVVVWALYKEWELSSKQFSLLQTMLYTQAHDFHSVDLNLPSQRMHINNKCNFACEVVYDGRHQSLTFSLNWPQRCPTDFSSFNMHVWKAHCQLPELDFAKIILFDLQGESKKLVVSLRNATCLHEIRSQYLITRNSIGVDKTSNDNYLLLHAIFCHIRNKSTSFVKDCASTLQILKFEARRQPSASKIDFLSQLVDSLELSKSAIRQVVSQIHKLHTVFENHDVRPRTRPLYLLIKLLKEVSCDLNYVTRRLEELKTTALSMKTEISESIAVAQSWRTNVVTLIVAFYVPLSFASSIFGMNLSEPPGLQEFFFSSNSSFVQAIKQKNMTANIATYAKYFESAQDSLSRDTQAGFPRDFNMTGATIVSTPKTWSTKDFLYIATPLVAGTIILPLIGGTAFGVAARFTIKHRLWVRKVLIGFLILYVYMVYSMVPMLEFYVLGPLFFEVLMVFMLFKRWRELTADQRLLRMLFFCLITACHFLLVFFRYNFWVIGLPSPPVLPWVGLGLWFIYPKFQAWLKRRKAKPIG